MFNAFIIQMYAIFSRYIGNVYKEIHKVEIKEYLHMFIERV